MGESPSSVAERAEPYGLGNFRICLLPWILGDDAGTRQSDWVLLGLALFTCLVRGFNGSVMETGRG